MWTLAEARPTTFSGTRALCSRVNNQQTLAFACPCARTSIAVLHLLASPQPPDPTARAKLQPPPPASVISARDSMSRITDTYTRVTLAHSTASSLSVALSPCDSKGSPSSTVFFSHRYYGYLTEPLRGERPLLGNPTIPGRAIQPIGTKSTNIDVILFPCHVFIFHAWG